MQKSALYTNVALWIIVSQIPALVAGSAFAQVSVNDEALVSEEITILGTKQERYNTRSSDIGRTNQEIIKIPRTVTVIPEQVLLDQQVYDLGDALKNVGGVTDGDGFGGTLTDYLIRGFRRDSIHRNGVRMSQVTNNQPPTQNIESIEVIKGPASVLYGQIEPGGLVNINTKKPSFESRGLAQLVFDGYGKKLGTIDVSGSASDTVAFRLNGSFERSNTFRDFYEIEREFFSPSLLWNVTPDTTATITYEYYRDNRPLDRGFVTLSDGMGGRFIPDNIPRSRRFGEDIEERDSKVHLLEFTLEHQFSADWKGTMSLLYRTEDEFDLQVRPVSVDTDGNMVRRIDGTNDRTVNTYNVSAWVNGEVSVASIKNMLSFGFDYRDESEDRFFSVGTNVAGFNIFNPVYGLITDTRTPPGDPRGVNEKAVGAFIQDQAFLTEQFSVLLGGRYDETQGDSLASGNLTIINKKTKFTPQFGLLYQPTESTSLYASYSEGFSPNTVIDPITGETFDPEESRQYEIGAKGRFLDEKLQVTASVYDLKKNNIVALNSLGTLDLIGEVRSRGLELEISGELSPGFNILGSYAYTDNEILTPTSANLGNRTGNVAAHTFRVWGSYEVRQGRYAGLGGGLGVNYTSDRYGDDSNAWSLGDYTIVDASLWYYLETSALSLGSGNQIRLGLNVKNLLDERYFPAAGNSTRINIGRPRTIIGSVGFVF